MGEILEAGTELYAELKNLIVWAKDNGGMGSFYRAQQLFQKLNQRRVAQTAPPKLPLMLMMSNS
jgi:hypothetical protein